MTTAFKVGDKVEYVKDHDGRTAGTKATVKYVGSGLITVSDEYGKENMVFPYRVKKPTHNGFEVGDKVKITGTDWAGRTGTVTNPNRGTSLWPIEVTVDDGGIGIYVAEELELIPEEKPFTYADIQVGDKIRRTRTYSSGSVEIREGVATDPAYGGYWSDGQFILAYPTDDNVKAKGTVTLELLERPEPEPEPVKAPEPWDNAKTGDVLFRVDKADGARDTFIKKADGGWTIFYPDGSAEFQIGAEEKLSSYFLGTECIAATVS